MTIDTIAIALNPTEETVFSFIAGQANNKSGTVESTGLAENAVALNVCNTVSTFRTVLHRLITHHGLVESVRSGKAMLYSLSESGTEYALAAEEKRTRTTKGDQRFMGQTLGEKLVNAGVASFTNYTQPSGVSLPKKGTYTEDVQGIVSLYKDRIKQFPERNELERLQEWYTKLEATGRPAFQWLQEAIVRTSCKVHADQRTFAYMLGILKNWDTYGYAVDFSAEHKKVFSLFEERFSVQMSEQARKRMLGLIDSFGFVDTLASMFGTSVDDVDLSTFIVSQMEGRLAKEE